MTENAPVTLAPMSRLRRAVVALVGFALSSVVVIGLSRREDITNFASSELLSYAILTVPAAALFVSTYELVQQVVRGLRKY